MTESLWRTSCWTLVAFIVGIGASYGLTKGVNLAYGATATQINNFVLNPNKIVQQKIPAPSFQPIFSIQNRSVSIGFVGDIFPSLDAPSDLFSEVLAYTEAPDIMIGNLEGTISQAEYNKCQSGSVRCFSFNGDGGFLKTLSLASFDVLNIANNHANDRGEIGREETIANIEESGMVSSGVKNEIAYVKASGLTVGFVGFSTYWWTSDMNNKQSLEKTITEAKRSADIVVVIFHGGGEGVGYSRTPSEREWYLNEDRGDVRDFAHTVIDAGADVVFGSGPHTLRGIEAYRGKLIAYSLGNFAAASGRVLTDGSLKTSAMIEVTLDEVGSFISGKVFSFELSRSMIPHVDLNNTAVSIMNDLSKSDFGYNGVQLSPSGEILFR